MLAVENVEGASPTFNLAVSAQEVGRAQPDRCLHAGKKYDPLKGQRDARGDVEVRGCVCVGTGPGPGVSSNKSKIPFSAMGSFAPFNLDAAIPPLSEINADIIRRVAAGTMCIEPCLEQFCDDKRFRSVPGPNVTSNRSCRLSNILGEQRELSHMHLSFWNRAREIALAAEAGNEAGVDYWISEQ